MKTYRGSCHCGAVRFEADLDLAAGTGKCNCTYCWKVRNWSMLIKPEAFRVIAGEDQRSEYSFGTGAGKHAFCKHCGVRTFSRGYLEEVGGAFVSVAMASLDDLDPVELVGSPVTFFDGRNDNWWNTPSETRHL